MSLGHGALDGTKVQPNATKHKAKYHEQMRKAEILDAQEKGTNCIDKLGSDRGKELRRRQDRLEKIKQARQTLEASAAAAARDRAKQAIAAEAAAADAEEGEQQKLREKADR